MTIDWFLKYGSLLTSVLALLVAALSLWVSWRGPRRQPNLHFEMRAVIGPPNVHPRELIYYQFWNDGTAPVHVRNIEGDHGFTFIDGDADYFDPVTIAVDPEPFEGEACAEYLRLLERRPTRIYALDSTGKKWPLRKKDLVAVYRVLDDWKASQADPK